MLASACAACRYEARARLTSGGATPARVRRNSGTRESSERRRAASVQVCDALFRHPTHDPHPMKSNLSAAALESSVILCALVAGCGGGNEEAAAALVDATLASADVGAATVADAAPPNARFTIHTLRPAHSRCHRISWHALPEAFNHFVSSMIAPVASPGWSGLPGGICTHRKAPPLHGARHKRRLAGSQRQVTQPAEISPASLQTETAQDA